MRGNPASDNIKLGISKEQVLRIGRFYRYIRQAAFGGAFSGIRQHFRRNIGGDDLCHIRSQFKRRMPAARRNVAGSPPRLRRGKFQQSVKVCALRMRRAVHVSLRELAEPLARLGFRVL